MRRYWVEPQILKQSPIQIDGDLFHHIFQVCRQDVGNHFELISDDSVAYLVQVKDVQKKYAVVEVKETRQIPPLPKPTLHLALSVPKFQVMEDVLEKAVELGVSEIVPFFSEFSFVRSEKSWPQEKQKRWDKIILSATQQSGRGELLKLQKPTTLNELLKNFNPTPQKMGLFAYEGESRLTMAQYLKQTQSQAENLDEIWVFVGSEGGFSPTEVQLFSEHGLQSVTLGEQVLRVETACIALLSILKYSYCRTGL